MNNSSNQKHSAAIKEEGKARAAFERVLSMTQSFREAQHRLRRVDWGPCVIDPGISETIGSIVSGKQGHGGRGQQKGNKEDGELNRGDYEDNTECKKADRVFPNMDFELPSSGVYNLGTKGGDREFIHVDEQCLKKVNPSTYQQIQPEVNGIHRQFQSNACSVQLVEYRDGTPFAVDKMARTAGPSFILACEEGVSKWDSSLNKDSISGEPRGDYGCPVSWDRYISKEHLKSLVRKHLTRAQSKGFSTMGPAQLISLLDKHDFDPRLEPGMYVEVNGKDRFDVEGGFWFMLRQERGHFNIGNHDKETMRKMLEDGFILVSFHHDRLGRVCCAVFELKPEGDELKKILARYLDADTKNQQNWYLFPDNKRDVLATGSHSLLELGAKLMAHAVQQPDLQFKTLWWNPETPTPLTDKKVVELLTELPKGLNEIRVEPAASSFVWEKESDRINGAKDLWTELTKFYRGMRCFTEATNTSNNIGFGKVAEHFDLLLLKNRGCRSGARGADGYECDGSGRINEFKTVSGRKGDAMGSKHSSGTIHLGNPGVNGARIKSWGRLIVNNIQDRPAEEHGLSESPLLHLKILAPTKETMEMLGKQAEQYELNVKDSSDLQYSPQKYDSDSIGGSKRPYMTNNGDLDFVKVAEFVEGKGLLKNVIEVPKWW